MTEVSSLKNCWLEPLEDAASSICAWLPFSVNEGGDLDEGDDELTERSNQVVGRDMSLLHSSSKCPRLCTVFWMHSSSDLLPFPHFQRSRSYVTPPAGTFLDESGRGLPGSGTNVSARPFQTSYRLPHTIQRAKKRSCWKASNGLVKVSRDSRLAWIITLNTFNSLIVREGTRFAVLHTPLLRILREMCFRQNISKTMPLHSFNLN